MTRAVLACCALMLWSGAYDQAFAQDTAHVWDIEIHAGLSSTPNQQSGSGVLPTTGTTVQGEISASTFYLGEGARLFNENQRLVNGGPSIVPLDSVLLSAMIARETGPAFGVRMQRAIKSRFAVQVNGDLSLDHLSFTPAALSAIETTRSSYTTAIQRALSASALVSNVTADVTITDRQSAPQAFATGAFVVKLKTSGRAIPYLTGGGGVVLNLGDTPEVTLVGNYSLGKPPQLLGTDSVTITFDEDSMRGVGLFGGGFTYDLTSKWGLRVDARDFLYRNTRTNVLAVTPTLGFQSVGQPYPIVQTGTLQFGTTSPLNGAPVSASTTFTGSGLQNHLIVSAGLVLRF